MKKTVLGVKIDDITMDEAVKIVEGWLEESGKKHFIVTPNPEFLVMAQEDAEFKRILNQADLSIPDGKGLRIGTDIECIIPGIDLMEKLIKLAAEKGAAVGFLGGRDGVAELTAERLQKKHPGLKVSFASSGRSVGFFGFKNRYALKTQKISTFAPSLEIPRTDILFVAFGAPKQEFWIAKNLDKLNVKVAMGVGGAFDYISGRVPRAPLWVRNLGFEWLFRLIVQPWRIKRQMRLLKYFKLLMLN